MDEPADKALLVDASKTYQSIVGFGGAFTEAAAINWRSLSPEDQEKVIKLYFSPPSEGGHGYSLGRVPINSCDFSPASYNFDNVTGDADLTHFDADVKHDVEVGMIPMIQAALKEAAKGTGKFSLFASPWSPPGWMKLPVDGKRGMTISASPNCLDPTMQDAWAKYFSRFISAYKSHGIDVWGVTVQNEPEAAVGWEACLYTPDFMASFVRDHLGPTLANDHPNVKIIGFDHNKDHVLDWAKVLYADANAASYFSGIGVHWYGGLNTNNLNRTHELAPDKFILATEACNCGGVVYQKPDLAQWWSRAESLGLDILEDLRFWAVGWTDWNLLLSTKGGPNHLKNLCDANIIVDAQQELNRGTLIMQASYYFMGHFSRFIPPGSLRTKLVDSVAVQTPPITADDVKNGQALVFQPCDGDPAQRWMASTSGSVHVVGTDTAIGSDGYEHGGMCIDFATDSPYARLQVWQCWDGSPNQTYNVTKVPGGQRIFNIAYQKCVTVVKGPGNIAGADPGTTVTAAQLHECKEPGDPSQTFFLANYDGQGFPTNFPIRWDGDMCLQPRIERVPHFDSVSFISPEGVHTLVVMNIGVSDIGFSLYDESAKMGAVGLSVPAHSIQSYTWSASGKLSVEAEEMIGANQAVETPLSTVRTADKLDARGRLHEASILDARHDDDLPEPHVQKMEAIRAALAAASEGEKAQGTFQGTVAQPISASSPAPGLQHADEALPSATLQTEAVAATERAERQEEAQADKAAKAAQAARFQANEQALPLSVARASEAATDVAGTTARSLAALAAGAAAVVALVLLLRRSTVLGGHRGWRAAGGFDALIVEEDAGDADYAPFVSVANAQGPGGEHPRA